MKSYRMANGDEIPALGLGTWKSERGKVAAAVGEALRIGYRHVDCAPIYGNEAEIGTALESAGVAREELWITSKLWNDAHEEDAVVPALAKTLADLRLDYLDLFLIHWPVVLRKGANLSAQGDHFRSLEEVPLSATWRGMEECLARGLCKHIGVSNFSAKKLAGLLESARARPEVNQIEAHPYLQQAELLAYCQRENILVCAYSPLGSGDRPASLKRADEPSLLEHPLILQIAGDRDLTPAQVLLAWGIDRGTVVLAKSVSPERLAENFRALDAALSLTEREALDGLDAGYRYVDGSFWERPGSPYTARDLWD